ncbi:MAG: hypothetical protein K6L73_03040 [Cellvibrionaceae bacterium]
MRKQIVLMTAFILSAAATTAKAEFPAYLSKSYCNDLKKEFMVRVIPSLKNYSTERFSRDKRASLRNTKKYLDKNIDWLEECTDFMSKTEGDWLFKDKKTTKMIFASAKDVSREMGFALDGVLFFDDIDPVTREFDELFEVTDTQTTMMQLNGELASY